MRPETAEAARRALVDGNGTFTHFVNQPSTDGASRRVLSLTLEELGMSEAGTAPTQKPFAAFLGCADARVPVEIIFGQAANDLFVVRVAGNVLGAECLGSLDFAVERLGTVRLLGVLGHTGCGAVTAAVDAYLVPSSYLGVAANLPLQSIVAGLLAPVRAASHALQGAYGDEIATTPTFHAAAVELGVVLNAALVAGVLRSQYRALSGERLGVVYGVYNLVTGSVGRPNPASEGAPWEVGLFDPPDDEAGFAELANTLARSRYIQRVKDEG